MRGTAERLEALTGVRILAALAVYASHAPPPDAPGVVTNIALSGHCGVTIFFVLSGFVLAINYFEGFRHPSAGGLYNFFVARFARVYPLYALLLLYFVIRQHALGESIDGWWRSALAIQAWDPDLSHAYAFDAPAWSISVEFFLYASFPLLVPLIGRLRRPRSLLLLAGGIAVAMLALAAWFVLSGQADLPRTDPASAHRWIYRTPLTRLGDFALGIIAARLYVQERGRPSVARLGRPLTLGAIGMVVALMALPGMAETVWTFDVAFALPAVLLIFGLAIAPQSIPARALSLAPVVLLGEASYAFYLVHQPAIAYLGAGDWPGGFSATGIAFEALTLGAIIAMAIGLHVMFEAPARTFFRRVLSWPPGIRRGLKPTRP